MVRDFLGTLSFLECLLNALGRRPSGLVYIRPLVRGVFQFTRGALIGKTRRRTSFKENSLTVVNLLWRSSSACTLGLVIGARDLRLRRGDHSLRRVACVTAAVARGFIPLIG